MVERKLIEALRKNDLKQKEQNAIETFPFWNISCEKK